MVALRVRAQRSILPGFGLALGITMVYLSLVVLIPLSGLLLRTLSLSLDQFWAIVSSPRALAAYRLSFGASLIAALINGLFGLLIAWVLVRYPFPGRALVDGLIDLPFALPTAVGGLALTAVYAENGWIGRYLMMLGIKAAFTPLGVVIALTFIGLPFVVRTVQPVLRALDRDVEEAAQTLGSSPWQTFWRVILPALLPATLTGMTLAFARAIGEYGSVVFIAGNVPLMTEITPLLIMIKLEQFDYPGATALALVMLVVSFALLLVVNMLQAWSGRQGKER